MKIYITGDIDVDNFAIFSKELDEAEESNEDVEIILNSGGGVSYDGLAFYSRIRNSPLHVTVTCYGQAASAASLILLAGDHRRMVKTAWFMVHEDELSLKHDNVTTTGVELRQYERTERQWNYLMSKHTKLSAAKWAKLSLVTTYMNAKECLEAGVVDEII